MLDSTVLTIGTALRRAQDAGLPVDVLIHGQWISGFVLGLDGTGAILDCGHGDSAVIRLEDTCAVRVHPAKEHAEPAYAPPSHQAAMDEHLDRESGLARIVV